MSRRPRAYIPLTERLAAALACLLPQEQRDDLRARRVPARVVVALFEVDHLVLHAPPFNGSDKWHNLDPKLKAPHREKSRRDTIIVAKTKRLAAKTAERPATGLRSPLIGLTPSGLVQAADAQNALSGRPKRKIPSRPHSWPKRKMQSRPFGR